MDLVRIDYLGEAFEFNLPNLQSIRLEHCEINGLTLDAPKLVELKIWYIGEPALVLIKDFLSFQLKSLRTIYSVRMPKELRKECIILKGRRSVDLDGRDRIPDRTGGARGGEAIGTA